MSDWSDGPNVTAETRNAVEWGKKVERERIIALLESEDWDAPDIATPYVRHIVALIKGDDK